LENQKTILKSMENLVLSHNKLHIRESSKDMEMTLLKTSISPTLASATSVATKSPLASDPSIGSSSGSALSSFSRKKSTPNQWEKVGES